MNRPGRLTPLCVVFALAILADFAGGLSGTSAATRQTVRIGHLEKTTGSVRARDVAPLLAHLDRSPAFHYTEVPFANADELVAALRERRVDAAMIGALQYVKLRRDVASIPLAAEGSGYRSVIVVRADSDLRNLGELRGRRFGFGYPESTSSHLYPLFLLGKAGVRPEQLGAQRFMGGQGQVLEGIASGAIDAGGVAQGELERRGGGGFRILATSPKIPGMPVVVLADAPKPFVDDLRNGLFTWKPATRDPAVAFSTGFEPVADDAYNPIRSVAHIVLGKDYRTGR